VLAGCGSPGSADGFRYVALGDSYTSGPGIEPMRWTTCQRSTENYPSLVARRLDIRTFHGSFHDVSCGGASTANVFHRQTLVGQQGPQLDSIDDRTTLVTVSIGFNDSGLANDLLYGCMGRTADDPQCAAVLGQPDSVVAQRIADAADHVTEVLRAVRKKAPHAQVILIGYPRIVPDTGACPDRYPVPEAMVERLRSAMPLLDEAMTAAAKRASVDYVDTYDASKGHDVCSAEPWVNGSAYVAGESTPLHPFASYHRAVADAVVDLVKRK
jgi:lysophospholipase L1-like esterase